MLSDTRRQRYLAALLLICTSYPASAKHNVPASNRDQAASRADLRAVLGAFRRAIITKDEIGFLALFHAGSVVWQSVDSLATRLADGVPDREPAFRDPGRTPQSFI